MLASVARFLDDQDGTASLDWVVLTAMLVGTTVAVVGTFSDGVETMMTVGPHVQLREDVVGGAALEGDLCRGGTDALQAREDARATTAGQAPLDVAEYMQATYADYTTAAIRLEYMSAAASAAGGGDWTIDSTLLGALECEMVLRGLD